MAKLKRKHISLDVDSALVIMQEVYNDVELNKNNATLIMKKMLNFMKEAEDMTLIGPVIKDQQKILNDCAEKKISLVKLQSNLLKISNTGTGNNSGSGVGGFLSDEDRAIIEKMMAEDNETSSDNGQYEV